MDTFILGTALIMICCCFMMTLWIIKKLIGI